MYSNTNSNSVLSQQHRETHTQDTIINIIEPEIYTTTTDPQGFSSPPTLSVLLTLGGIFSFHWKQI